MIKTNGGFLISQIKQIQGRVLEHMLTDAGISEFNGAQGRILYVLWQKDDMPIAELSKRTGLAKNTLTTMLDRMTEAGHICRTPDPDDRRQIRITRQEIGRIVGCSREMVGRVLKTLEEQGMIETEGKAILIFDASLEQNEVPAEDESED